MQAPSSIPYQAYRPKRHSRNLSIQGQGLPVNVSPPPAARPPAAFTNGNLNGFSHNHNLSEPIVPLQRDFESEKGEKESYLQSALSATNGFGARVVRMIDETRRTVSMTDVLPSFDARRSSTPSPAVSPDFPPVHPTANAPSLTLTQNEAPTAAVKAVPSPTSEQDVSSPASETTEFSSSSLHSSETQTGKVRKELPSSEPVSGPSSTPQTSPGPSPRPTLSSLSSSRKSSTFRHVPLRVPSARPTTSSPLRPQSTHARMPSGSGLAISSRQLGPPSRTPEPASRLSSPQSGPASPPGERDRGTPIPSLDLSSGSANTAAPSRSATPQSLGSAGSNLAQAHTNQPVRAVSLTVPAQPQPRRVSPAPSTISPPTQPASPSSPSPPQTAQRASTPSRSAAPYRAGFQPKGVYRPRTDEYLETRRTRSDAGRVERTRLERRLEKLIDLHFPHPDRARPKEGGSAGRPGVSQNRRASSFFDIDIGSLKGKSAGELWRGVVQSQAAVGKNDIRTAEQTITPWEDDSTVSSCPLCLSSFHPLTNRKHHCRLCGRIICSLPLKYPQRPQQCSLLFVADAVTGHVEEVNQGVDYGVRRRTNANGKGKEREEEEKFLKGVRICRECRPVLLRRQYIQEVHKVPLFVRLYEVFIALEKEIEDSLPQFQELMLSLSHEERPSPEASTARKRLLEAFAQYDAVAKRMRKLPCPEGPGSSQDRVQQAIVNRANAFLQKNMFPLQALPKPKRTTSSSSPAPQQDTAAGAIDPDSEVARVLQPLLEQEALLESFVEEAKAHRKFEDAQTLKANLAEIRAEIERILANAEVSGPRGS